MLPPYSNIRITDSKLMNYQFFDQSITQFRRYWLPVIDQSTYRRMKSLLLSSQDLTASVKNYFTDEEFTRNTVFEPLPIMEKTRNIIIDQAREAGLKPYIEAVDPAATVDKKQDMFRLKNMQKHIAEVNKVRENVGEQTPYALREKDFNGNVQEFTKMGMNPQDESQVKFFFDTHYKLNYEIAAQTTVLSYLTTNKAENDIPRYCIDIMSVKCFCKQDYVSRLTGQIITKYLQPTNVYVIKGNNRDLSDAACKGWERQITIQELMNTLGDQFNFERDWRSLLIAINYASGGSLTFDGFIHGGRTYNAVEFNTTGDLKDSTATDQVPNLLNCDSNNSEYYNYKVFFGFIEWPQYCLHTEKRNVLSGQMFPVDNDYIPPEKGPWVKEEWGYFKTKQSYYIATGTMSQRLYAWGDMYMMPTLGQSDEFSAGSISIVREEGKSAVGIVEPYIKLANYAYYKMLWVIHRSKPDQWDFEIDSLVQVAMKMNQSINKQGANTPQGAGQFGDALNTLIEKFDKKLFKLHVRPNIDGMPVGGGSGSGHVKTPGSLDALAVQLREIVLDWAEQQVADKFGMSGIANAQAPNPRDGQKLNEMYLRQSRAATGYIPRLIDQSFRVTADTMLMYIQDILKFPGTIAYKYLYNLVGQDIINDLRIINDAAPRRYAITATSYSNWPDKQAQLQEGLMAFQKGLITFSEYQLLKLIDDPRVAAKQSAFFQEQGERRKEAQQKAANDFALQLEDKKFNNLFTVEKYKADQKTLQERIRTNGYIYQADKMAESKIDAANITAGAAVEKEDTKLENKKEELQDKATIQLQESLIKPTQ